jgi:serine/threonine-protein kinase
VQHAARQRVGTTLLGKWRIDALLGVGGMAAVYAATHRNGARGALKMLHREQSADDEIRSRFLREGYIANRVEHPGAVRVLDDDVDDEGNAFLVMELLSGQSLNDRAARSGGRLALEELLVVTDQLLDVLAAAHDRGIVHRDVKPENVFLCDDGRVKILDFGIARLREPHANDAESAMSTTHAGLPMGTPAFMSPEQARGRWDMLCPQSDIWSVGATMFTLLTAQLVHQEQTVSEVLAATFLKPARSLSAALPGAPHPVVDVVDRALYLRTDERWPDARAMQAAVRTAYRRTVGLPMPPMPEQGGRTSSAPPAAIEAPILHILSTRPIVRRRRGVIAAAVGLALGMVTAATGAVALRSAAARPEDGPRVASPAVHPSGRAEAPRSRRGPAVHTRDYGLYGPSGDFAVPAAGTVTGVGAPRAVVPIIATVPVRIATTLEDAPYPPAVPRPTGGAGRADARWLSKR